MVRSIDLRNHIAAERSELLEFLRTLSADEWLVPSLCEGWRVRDVVAHLLWDNVSVREYLWVGVRYVHPDRVNQYYVDRARNLPTSELVTALSAMVDPGWLSRVMPGGMLADLVVHHQDIRRPLERPRKIDPSRLRHALDHPNRFAHRRRITKGLRLVATDLNWAVGSGPEVRGPAEVLALAITERRAVLDELSGDGVAILAQRMVSDR